LKDSLELIRIVEGLRFDADEQIMLTAADVNALYPSIQLERGMAALRWFMDYHTSFNQTLKDLCLKLAHFVLTNNYVVCQELGDTIYRQIVGTAMGTSFSVVYAVIFMIRLETPIVNDVRFRQYIRLFKRFIDDLFLIWTGPAATLYDFRRALETADEAISLNWSGYGSHQDAVNPSLVTAKRHERVNYLDLDMSLQRVRTRTGATIRVLFRPFRKPGNAYVYIPFTSFHGRHTFRGWVLAELIRLMTHSSTPEIWREEGSIFLPSTLLQRIPAALPQNSLSRGHMGTEVSVTRSKPPKEMRRVFQDLPGMCPHPPQRTGVARAEGAAGPEPQNADGGVHLWGHLSTASIFGSVQRAATRIDS